MAEDQYTQRAPRDLYPHRMLGFYTELPHLLHRAGVDWNDIVCWEDELEIRI